MNVCRNIFVVSLSFFVCVFAPSALPAAGDGEITITDATALLNSLAAASFGGADLNADGTVDIRDVTFLLNVLAGEG